MTHELLYLLIVTLIVVTDNALLAGLLLPYVGKVDKLRLTIAVAVAIAFSQAALAVVSRQLLQLHIFRIAAIVVLVWMSIQTLRLSPSTRGFSLWKSFAKVFTYTVVGNVDNMIWLGAAVHDHSIWLVVFSLLAIPLFIGVSLLLSYECERHRWVVLLGAGMPAWASVTLFLDTQAAHKIVPANSFWTHVALSLAIVVAGLLFSRVRVSS